MGFGAFHELLAWLKGWYGIRTVLPGWDVYVPRTWGTSASCESSWLRLKRVPLHSLLLSSCLELLFSLSSMHRQHTFLLMLCRTAERVFKGFVLHNKLHKFIKFTAVVQCIVDVSAAVCCGTTVQQVSLRRTVSSHGWTRYRSCCNLMNLYESIQRHEVLRCDLWIRRLNTNRIKRDVWNYRFLIPILKHIEQYRHMFTHRASGL